MSLLNDLQKDMVQAMKAKDKTRLSVIRMVRASLQNEAIQKGSDLSTDNELSVLSRELKQRRESLEEFQKAGRDDLVDQLENEIIILQQYMPAQLSTEEITKLVKEAIHAVNATSVNEFGKVMGYLMPNVKGKADGSKVQQIVKEQLQA